MSTFQKDVWNSNGPPSRNTHFNTNAQSEQQSHHPALPQEKKPAHASFLWVTYISVFSRPPSFSFSLQLLYLLFSFPFFLSCTTKMHHQFFILLFRLSFHPLSWSSLLPLHGSCVALQYLNFSPTLEKPTHIQFTLELCVSDWLFPRVDWYLISFLPNVWYTAYIRRERFEQEREERRRHLKRFLEFNSILGRNWTPE